MRRQFRRFARASCLLAMAATTSIPANANLRDDLRQCASVGNDNARLACFDALVADLSSDSSRKKGGSLLGEDACPVRHDLEISRKEIGRLDGLQLQLTDIVHCEAVAIESIYLDARRLEEQIEVVLEARIRVFPSFDRRVDLRLEFLDPEGQPVFEERFRSIDAEEEKVTRVRRERQLDVDTWASIFEEGRGVLRVEMMAIKD